MSLIDGLLESLKGRLLLSLSVGLTLTLAVAFFGLHSLIRSELYAQLETQLRAHLDSLTEFAIENPGHENSAEFDPEFRAKAHEDFFQIWDGNGVVIARSDSSSGRDLPTPSVAQKDSHSAYDLKLPDGHRGRALAHVAVLPPDDPRGTITAVLAKETESLEQLETSVHRWLALVALAVVAVTLLVVWYSVSGGLKTVDDLADIAQRIDPDSPRETIDLQSLPAELRPVARKLISLLDGLWSALDRERRFARNVAHELRNPLAEARMLADVGGMAVSLEDAQDSMREVSVAVSELEQIVESLLAMARYEAGHARPQQEPVNLTETISRQLAILESAAKMRDLDIRVELPRERWILSDAELLKRLISNVIGNAVAHAPRSSTVEIQMAEDGAFCTMNQAPQLSTDELPKLGERFFRIDTGDGRTHAGLGLSLAQSIARILALDFEIRLDANSTLTARIHGFRRLPL